MTFKDHLGRTVEIPTSPQRIISLCPSQTSTLVAMGLGDRIVGRTQFCIHPKEVMEGIAVVGGTKNLKRDKVEALNPDLVICEKEENTPEMVAWLSERCPVFVTDVQDLESARRMVLDLGLITGVAEKAQALSEEIEAAMKAIVPITGRPSVLYFIWRKPWMTAGAGTYIHSVLEHLGFHNLAVEWEGRYPGLPASVTDIHPNYVFLSSEPFPFKDKHVKELQEMFPSAKVMLVDGEIFSWYGDKQLEIGGYWEVFFK